MKKNKSTLEQQQESLYNQLNAIKAQHAKEQLPVMRKKYLGVYFSCAERMGGNMESHKMLDIYLENDTIFFKSVGVQFDNFRYMISTRHSTYPPQIKITKAKFNKDMNEVLKRINRDQK
jgi:hypothetical protein